MITDKLENIDIYSDIPKVAKDFIKKLNIDTKSGRIVLSDDIYANIETYTTKMISDGKFEAHNKYIDIQILLNGRELIYYTGKTELTVNVPYDEEKDITFYSQSVSKYPSIKLDGLNFVMLFPHEAHAPQICDRIPSEVKKVVVKIKV